MNYTEIMEKKSLVVLIFYYWIPLIIYAGIIFVLSSRQRIGVSSSLTINTIIFKSLHMFVFSGLYFMFLRAYYRTFTKFPMKYIYIFAIISSILYAISDEYHQTYTPTRGGSPRDVVIDTVGILLMFRYTKNYLNKLKYFL